MGLFVFGCFGENEDFDLCDVWLWRHWSLGKSNLTDLFRGRHFGSGTYFSRFDSLIWLEYFHFIYLFWNLTNHFYSSKNVHQGGMSITTSSSSRFACIIFRGVVECAFVNRSKEYVKKCLRLYYVVYANKNVCILTVHLEKKNLRKFR